jgi:hypothetical protein
LQAAQVGKRSGCCVDYFQNAVIVTMIAVRMVQMTINQVIHMVAMGHSFVAAGRSVDVGFTVTSNFMIAGAAVRMRGVNLNHVCGHSFALLVFQVALFQIISMPVMFDGGMAATRAVLMLFGIFHRAFRSLNWNSWRQAAAVSSSS